MTPLQTYEWCSTVDTTEELLLLPLHAEDALDPRLGLRVPQLDASKASPGLAGPTNILLDQQRFPAILMFYLLFTSAHAAVVELDEIEQAFNFFLCELCQP